MSGTGAAGGDEAGGTVPGAGGSGLERLANRLDREGADVPPRRAELRRLADAARSVIDRLVATEAPIGALTAAADALEAALAELAAHPQGRLYEGFAEVGLSGAADPMDGVAFFEHSPIIGLANPLAPPVRLEVRDGAVHGTVRFGSAYEGPPSSVHGGYVAAAFDEVLGMAQ